MGDLAGGIGVLNKVLGNPMRRAEDGRVGSSREKNQPDKFNQIQTSLLDRFRLISKIDEMWNLGVARGLIGYDIFDEQEIAGYYRLWLVDAEGVVVEREEYQSAGISFPESQEFLNALENARGICTPDESFFAGPELEAMRDHAIAAYHTGETVEIKDPRD